MSSVALAQNQTAAPRGPVASCVMSPGHLTVGGVVSFRPLPGGVAGLASAGPDSPAKVARKANATTLDVDLWAFMVGSLGFVETALRRPVSVGDSPIERTRIPASGAGRPVTRSRASRHRSRFDAPSGLVSKSLRSVRRTFRGPGDLPGQPPPKDARCRTT